MRRREIQIAFHHVAQNEICLSISSGEADEEIEVNEQTNADDWIDAAEPEDNVESDDATLEEFLISILPDFYSSKFLHI